MKNRIDLTKFKSSSVGTTIESADADLTIDTVYSFVSWFFITFFGTSRTPEEIRFTCNKTEETFEILKDKELIEHFMTYTKK